MKNTMKNQSRRYFGKGVPIVSLLILFAVVCFFGCSTTTERKTDADSTLLASPLEESKVAELKPGLSVIYVFGFWRNLFQMPSEEKAKKKGVKGEPIPYLNHRFEKGMVFKSGRSRGVGMFMNGYLKFGKPGDYVLQARTNDGFRLKLAGIKVIDDSSWHSDRFSSAETVRVKEPGWYPLHIQYFQRKGTATIELYWKMPGDSEKSIIPAEAYAHIPEMP